MNSPSSRALLPALAGGSELPDLATFRAYKFASADKTVQRLTTQCVRALTELVEQAGYEHFLHAGVMGSAMLEATPATPGAPSTPSTPAQWLEVQLGMLRAEIEWAKDERATAVERSRGEAAARQPLDGAVDRLSRSVAMERESLVSGLAALRSNSPRKSRWAELREAGLSEAQIAALDLKPHELDEGVQAQACRDRIAVLDAQLAKCCAFAQDPLHDPEHVRGLGFDHLVNAQLARVAAAYSAV